MKTKLFEFDGANADRKEEIKSVIDLVREIVIKIDEKERIYYRGLPDISFELIPSIARLDKIKYLEGKFPKDRNKNQDKYLKAERNLIKRFKKHAYESIGRNITDWEALFLGRHYELPVRLMDWTTNPLVALYNATCSNERGKKDGVIWFFSRKEDDSKDIDVDKDLYPFDISGIRLIYPFNLTPKMTAQCSVFTIHEPPWKDLRKIDKDEFDSDDLDIKHGGRYRIPKEEKAKIQKVLYKLGINALTLHLDMPNIVLGLKQREIIPYINKI
jgi:hypothetical protein